MKFEAVVFGVTRVVTINCESILPDLNLELRKHLPLHLTDCCRALIFACKPSYTKLNKHQISHNNMQGMYGAARTSSGVKPYKSRVNVG